MNSLNRSLLILSVVTLSGACSDSPEELRAQATALEEQRTQLVSQLWTDFKSSSKMGALDVMAAKVAPKGDSTGEQLARGLVGSVLQGVKSGLRERFDAQIQLAGGGKVVNSGSETLDAYFAGDAVRASCRQANELRAKVEDIQAKLAKLN